MKKRLIITSAAALLLLAAVIFLPFPSRIDKELTGRRITGRAEEETIEIQLHGWRFHYLARRDLVDTVRGDIRISPFTPEEEVLEFSFAAPVLSSGGSSRIEAPRYSAPGNEFISTRICFTDGFGGILYTDGSTGGSMYIASDDPDRDLTALMEELSE